MPTINCSLNSSPMNECEDKKTGFMVALIFFWAVLRSLVRSWFRRTFRRSRTDSHRGKGSRSGP